MRRRLAPAPRGAGPLRRLDQFVDRTTAAPTRSSTGRSCPTSAPPRSTTRRSAAIALEVIREHGITVHDGGTVVVIQGPRFSTKAESKWFTDAGWEVINMTQYPEAYLCRELGMAVVNIALITDYDAGVLEGTEAVTAHDVLEVFEQNAERIRAVVLDMVGRFPADLDASARASRCATPAATGTRAARPTSGSSRPACSRPAMTPTPSVLPAATEEPLHGCVRCGARIPMSEAMCERCNPLGLKQPSASQAHGTVFVGIAVAVVALAVIARLAVSGIGPFKGEVAGVEADPGRPRGLDHGHQRRLDRRRDDLPHRRPGDPGHRTRGRVRHQPDHPAGRDRDVLRRSSRRWGRPSSR